jgi:hypothetical protein
MLTAPSTGLSMAGQKSVSLWAHFLSRPFSGVLTQKQVKGFGHRRHFPLLQGDPFCLYNLVAACESAAISGHDRPPLWNGNWN